mmetsp:Transcript_8389/g.25207  ORF Transcript_8389/g.25207 Transcript_8389/m.25207 type:complete len:132 (+) Transcript_8389:109-504(+)
MATRKQRVKPGFSMMAWNKRSAKAQRPPPRAVPTDEVAQHATEADAWTVLDGRVYDMTAYLPYHPGGVEILLPVAGRDCTKEFRRYHAYINGHTLLRACYVGPLAGAAPMDVLDESEDDESDSDSSEASVR